MSSLLHEIQHRIQSKEGFATGASPEYWNREETYNRAMEKWQDEHEKIFYHLSTEDKALYREYREISAREDELLENPTLEALKEMDALEERSDELYRELYGKDWFGKLNRLDRLMSDVEQAVKSMYWSTAGEIEARDSANRRSMTAEERKNSPPDTGDELTVFAESGATSNLSSNGVDEDTEMLPGENVKPKESQLNVDTDTETPAGTEIQRTQEQGQTSQEPLQDTGITDNRFTEALKKIGVNNITGSLVDYAGIEVEQQTARTAAEARRYLRRVLKETRADPRTQASLTTWPGASTPWTTCPTP